MHGLYSLSDDTSVRSDSPFIDVEHVSDDEQDKQDGMLCLPLYWFISHFMDTNTVILLLCLYDNDFDLTIFLSDHNKTPSTRWWLWPIRSLQQYLNVSNFPLLKQRRKKMEASIELALNLTVPQFPHRVLLVLLPHPLGMTLVFQPPWLIAWLLMNIGKCNTAIESPSISEC